MGATGLLAAGFGIQGISSIAGGIGQSTGQRIQGQYQNQMYQENAALADMQAKDAERRGAAAAGMSALQTSKRLGAQTAAFAASGVDPNSGSAAAIEGQTEGLGELDQLNIKNNAWREAWGYQVTASNDRLAGKMALLGANNAANNTLLTGGLNAASAFLKSGYALYGLGGGGGGGGSTWAGPDDGSAYSNFA